MKQHHALAPHLSGIAFATIFGFSFLIVKNTLADMSVFQLLGLRFLVAILLLEILRLTKVIKIKLSFRDIKALLPIALFQPVLYFVSEVYGIKNSTSGESGLMIGLIPVAVAVISWIFLKEKLSIKQIMFMTISLAGVIAISMSQLNGTAGESKPIGYLLLLGAVLSAAFYNILSRKVSKNHSPIKITYVMMIIGALVFNTIGFTDSLIHGYSYFAPLTQLSSLTAILYLGILSSVLAFFLVSFTLSKISAVQCSLYANLVAVISLVAGAVFLNESLSAYKIIGAVLIVIGVFGTSYFGKGKVLIKSNV